MRKLSVLALVCALLLLALAAPVFAAKSYTAERFDVELVVAADGSARVTETVRFRFEGDPFTFAFRTIPTGRTDGITEVVVRDESRVYLPGDRPGQVEVDRRSDEVRIKWHFEPTANTARTFTLTYHVAGIVRLDRDTGLAHIRWSAVPPEHEYLIESSRVTLRLPAGAPVRQTRTWEHSAEITQTGDETVTFAARGALGRNDELVVGVWTPTQPFRNLPPAWQAAAEAHAARTSAAAPFLFNAAVLILLVGGVTLITWRRRVPALPEVSSDLPIYGPPDDLAPALAASLAAGGPTSGVALGTLLDLARRGVITIREHPAEGMFSKPDFEFLLRDPDASLLPHERTVLDAAFAKADQPGRVRAKELTTGLQKANSSIHDAVTTSLERRGLFDPARAATRNRFAGAAFVLFLAGSLGLIPLIALFDGYGIPPAAAIIVVAIMAAVMAGTLSRRTPEGERAAAAWRSFNAFLKQVSEGRAPDAPRILEPYLPFAAAFGIEKRWLKQYAQADVPVPPWFQTTAGGVADRSSMTSFAAVMGSVSSSSSGAGASAGAAGASGGGSSGAG